MKERVYTVYMHTCLENSKKYIGITKTSVKRRWRNGWGYEKQTRFFNAIKKYGWDNFNHEIILCNLTKNEAEMFEVELIKFYKTQNNSLGYNIENGGSSGRICSEHTKKKLSNANTGKKMSKEARRKISLANTGRTVSKETRAKMSLAHMGRPKNPEAIEKTRQSNIGRKATKETREKQRAAKLGKKFPGRTVINISTGIVFKSMAEAAIFYNIRKSGIWEVCNGINKTCGGFEWKYL